MQLCKSKGDAGVEYAFHVRFPISVFVFHVVSVFSFVNVKSVKLEFPKLYSAASHDMTGANCSVSTVNRVRYVRQNYASANQMLIMHFMAQLLIFEST